MLSLGVVGAAALVQAAILVFTGSVALLTDLIHNVGDALTALPIGIAFLLRSFRAEKIAGLAVVLAIFVSACVALYETIERLINPQELSHLWVLAAAGLVGFVANELAAQIRVGGFVSPGVVTSAIVVALGAPIGDPIIGLLITAVILNITWDSWRTVSATEPGELAEFHEY